MDLVISYTVDLYSYCRHWRRTQTAWYSVSRWRIDPVLRIFHSRCLRFSQIRLPTSPNLSLPPSKYRKPEVKPPHQIIKFYSPTSQKLVRVLKRKASMFYFIVKLCKINLSCFYFWANNAPFLWVIMWGFCKRFRLHDWLTENDSTSQKPCWLLSQPIICAESFAEFSQDNF